MSTQRNQDSAECKARVALEALQGLKTVHELASTYGVHPTPMAPWKPRVQKERPEIFSARRAQQEQDQEVLHAQRYQQIGQQGGVGLAEKKLDWPPEAKREWIDPAHPQRSIAQQCDLLGLPRSPITLRRRERGQRIAR